MIVRILEEGQYKVPDSELAELEALDAELAAAIDRDDEGGFAEALDRLASRVRSNGTPVDAGTIVSSVLTIPHPATSLDEVKRLLASEEVTEG